MKVQFYQASKTSLVSSGGVTITEEYIPLWFADGTSVSTIQTASGVAFLNDGSALGGSTSAAYLIRPLSSNWNPNTKFALEASFYTGGSTAVVQLYDFSTGGLVGNQITTPSTTATIVRSSQFTLTPGHIYGVSVWTLNSSYAVNVIDASLIVFG